MTRLCQCPNCHCKFKTIGNLSKHRSKKHSNSVKASIRNGIRNSPNNPNNKLERAGKALQTISELVIAITPALVTKQPLLLLNAADEIKKTIETVQDLLK